MLPADPPPIFLSNTGVQRPCAVRVYPLGRPPDRYSFQARFGAQEQSSDASIRATEKELESKKTELEKVETMYLNRPGVTLEDAKIFEKNWNGIQANIKILENELSKLAKVNSDLQEKPRAPVALAAKSIRKTRSSCLRQFFTQMVLQIFGTKK